MKKIIKKAFLESILVSLLFILIYQFYNLEFIRENIEDIAFDVVNKFAIEKEETKIDKPNILIFGVDDNYMRANKLYDEYNNSTYGYFFPRDKIANFIEKVDEFIKEAEPQNRPKALFIDYDLSFTSMPYGKELSNEDKQLLDVLKKPRDYIIFLPKISTYNFVQYSKDKTIQALIKKRKIIFISVDLKQSNDGVTRRYSAYESYIEPNDKNVTYISINVALYRLLKNGKLILDINKSLKKEDIVANRILIKSYKDAIIDNNCSTYKSYWSNLVKYSANCNIFSIPEEDFANSIIMFGGTHSHNDDKFETLDVLSSDTFTGIEMHANAINTMLYLDGQLKKIPLWLGVLIVFVIFFTLSIFVSYIFDITKINNNSLEFIVVLVINLIILIAISILLLKHYHIWFNWFVPLILFEATEGIDFIKDNLPKVVDKIRKRN